MTPQELKSSILQLAVQGKLVEQRPEEGSAEELHRQIQAEKQKLIKEGKIKKEKLLPEITEDEIPFEIPDTWKWVRLGSIGDSNIGLTYRPSDIADSRGTIVLRSSNIQDDKMDYNDIVYVSCEVPKRAMISKGDILICARNGSRSLVGKSAIVDKDGMAFGAFMAKYCSICNPFVKVFLDSPAFRHQLDGVKTETINQITQKMIKLQMCPLPPFAEQKRIVAKIEELLPLIDRYEQAWSKLEAFNKRFPDDMQKSVLQMAIQGKLVEQRPEEGTGEELFEKLKPYSKSLKPCKNELDFSAMDFDIPHNWHWVELNQILNFVDYRGKTPHKISEGVFLITASNIKNGYMDYTRKEYISKEEYETRKSRGVTHKGDLLFTTEAPLGNTAICDLDECSCGQRIITFQEYEANTIIPKLFMYFILSPSFQKQLLDNCTGTTAKGIKAEKLKHLLIPFPPLAEQKRIVQKLEEILPLCEKLK